MNSLLDTRMATLQPSFLRMLSHQLARFLRALGYGAACLAFVYVVFLLPFTGVFCNLSMRRVDRARLDIRNFGNALKLYRVKTGRYPTTEEGFRALVEHGMLEQVPRDPWANEYQYLLWHGCPVVWSHGADGVPGGDGQDADLSTMGSSPPPWILQRAALAASRPPPAYCPWTLDQDGRG